MKEIYNRGPKFFLLGKESSVYYISLFRDDTGYALIVRLWMMPESKLLRPL